MGMTLFAVGALVAPLHQLIGELGRNWLARNTSRRARPLAPTGATLRVCTSRAIAPGSGHRPSRPLRVVRAAEPWRAPASAGRMVISGCMADVCAELDRLAALETAAVCR